MLLVLLIFRGKFSIATSYYEVFMNFVSFIDCIIFLIGAAYFVAGSYPDKLEDVTSEFTIDGVARSEMDSEGVISSPITDPGRANSSNGVELS